VRALRLRLIEKLQEVERAGREDAWQQQKRVAEQDARLEAERQQHAARLALADAASLQERDLRASIERVTRQLEENVAELTRAQVAQRATEADAKRCGDQLKQVSLRSNGGDSVLQEMIDDLRKTVNCTIHTNLPKDTVRGTRDLYAHRAPQPYRYRSLVLLLLLRL
jgi:hypothetical protein